MKVRLKKSPKTGDQLPDGGLYTDQYLPKTNQNSNPSLEVRGDEPKVAREDSNVEAEKGEYKIAGNLQTLTKIGGKKHSQGGTPILADPGDFIVSDKVKVNPSLIEGLKLPEAKKNTTWAKYLGKNVDPKYFNDLSYIQSKQFNGEEVDPYKAATAKHKLPKYQTTLSKIALGNELSKAAEGRDFAIPQVALPALMTLEQSSLTRGPQKMGSGGQVKMPNGGSYGQGMIDDVNAYGYKAKDFKDAQRYKFNTLFPELAGYYGQNIAPITNKGKRLYPGFRNNDLTPAQARNELTDGLWDYRDFSTGDTKFNSKEDYQNFIKTHPAIQEGDMTFYQDPAKSTAKNTMFTTARYTPNADIVQLPSTLPSSTISPDSLARKPISFQKTAKQVTDQKRADVNGYTSKPDVPNAPYSMLDQLALADAIGSKPKTYYPWAQKENPEYITPITDTPDYNAILSSQRTQGDLVNQISDASTARAIGSYQPNVIQGIKGETQRSRQFNIQQNQQAQFYNNQIKNRADSINAQIDTQLYDKNVLSNEQRDQSGSFWKNGIFEAANNMVNNRNQMQAFQVAMPQYTVDEFGNYRYNKNGATADSLKQGSPNRVKMILAQADSIANPEERKMFLDSAFKGMWK